ncbi:MAG: SDR family oxidoreductase [Clostridia bacterium]|nr:SDR family oxidoreductase [Clostridia bacterium]
MKTVVITGSGRGFGFEMAKIFKANNFNVVLTDINEENLAAAKFEVEQLPTQSKVISVVCDVTKHAQIENLWAEAVKAFGGVDIWINNAGVNQPDKPMCELTQKEIDFLVDVDLKGAVYGSKLAFKHMKEQGYGQIYNVEGYGSNDAMMTGLTLYGTTKRAITYFTQALAKESEDLTDGKVCVCRLTPGIMITEFIKSANGGKTKIELPEKTKKVYNILGDYPQTIANYCVPRMIKNTKNNAKIVWLTNARAFARFLTAGFNKRNFFE